MKFQILIIDLLSIMMGSNRAHHKRNINNIKLLYSLNIKLITPTQYTAT